MWGGGLRGFRLLCRVLRLRRDVEMGRAGMGLRLFRERTFVLERLGVLVGIGDIVCGVLVVR